MIKEKITLDVKIGDEILTGKWKNHREEVKDIGKDKYGMPTINSRKATTFRINKKNMKKEQLKQQLKKEIIKILNELKREIPEGGPGSGQKGHKTSDEYNLSTVHTIEKINSQIKDLKKELNRPDLVGHQKIKLRNKINQLIRAKQEYHSAISENLKIGIKVKTKSGNMLNKGGNIGTIIKYENDNDIDVKMKDGHIENLTKWDIKKLEEGRKSFRSIKFEEDLGKSMNKLCLGCNMPKEECTCDENIRLNKKLKEQLKPAILTILREEFGSITYNIPNMVCDKCGLPKNSCSCQQQLDRNKNEKAVLPKGIKFMKEASNLCKKCGNIIGSSQCKKYCGIKKEVTPPGREKQVKALKQKFPKDSAYKIAWDSYNKSRKK